MSNIVSITEFVDEGEKACQKRCALYASVKKDFIPQFRILAIDVGKIVVIHDLNKEFAKTELRNAFARNGNHSAANYKPALIDRTIDDGLAEGMRQENQQQQTREQTQNRTGNGHHIEKDSQSATQAVTGDLEQIDAKHVVIRSYSGKCFVMYMQDSPLSDGRKVPCFQKPSEFKAGYAFKYVQHGKSRPEPLGDFWFRNDRPGRRQYEGVTFKPGAEKIVNDHFNLWQDFGIAPSAGDWSLMQWHILHVLCSGNEEYANYLTMWLAWAVQNPDKPAEAAVALRGLKGIGKGLLGKYFGRLFGQHYLYVSNAKHVIGNFNAHLWDCVFLFCDEAFAQNNLQHDATLKSLITESTITIEPKGLGLFQTKNYLHLMLAANADWFVPATHDERRYFVLDVPDIYRGEVEYFARLCNQMEDGGCAAMLHDLLGMPLGKFHPRNPPKTTGLASQIEAGLSPEEQWWGLILRDGILPGAWLTFPACANSTPLFAAARERSPMLRMTGDALLARFIRSKGAKEHRTNTARGWLFPPLSECRADWTKRYPGTVWSHDQADWV